MTDYDPDDTDDSDEVEGDNVDAPTDQEVDQIIQRALKAAAKGENVDHLLEVITALFPPTSRDGIAKKFSRALAHKKLKQPSGDPDRAARSKLVRIHRMFAAIIEQQAINRVNALANNKPEVASDIKRQGKTLTGKGVKAGKERLTGADIGTIAPSPGVKPTRGKGSEREV